MKFSVNYMKIIDIHIYLETKVRTEVSGVSSLAGVSSLLDEVKHLSRLCDIIL